MPDQIPPASGPEAIRHTVDSSALRILILVRGIISLALVGAACLALYFGYQIYREAQPTHTAIAESGSTDLTIERADRTAALVEYGTFKLTASGLGAVVMCSSVLFGLLAVLARPTLKVGPRHGLAQLVVAAFGRRLPDPSRPLAATVHQSIAVEPSS